MCNYQCFKMCVFKYKSYASVLAKLYMFGEKTVQAAACACDLLISKSLSLYFFIYFHFICQNSFTLKILHV